LPEPEATPDLVRYVRTVAARAVATAVDDPPGPVHLNWPLREPLVPESSPEPAAWGARHEGRPYVQVALGPRAPRPESVAGLADALQSTDHGLIVCGPQDDPDFPSAVTALAARLGYPILADPLSGLRGGPHDRSLVLDAYDATLRLPDEALPEIVLRFGAPPTSKPLTQYLQRHPNAQHVLVDGGSGWRDPSALSSDVVHADPRLLCLALDERIVGRGPTAWTERWVRRDRATRHAIAEHLAGLDELFEGAVFPELASVLPDQATVYVGNSMPVRDLDTFFGATERPLRLLCNRGANGIDGVVSSAFGAVAGSSGPVVLVIGDVSFYHDMNGLLAARRHGLDLLVVLMHNDGGGIFSFLPQGDDAEHAEHYELLFGTPHGLDFRPFVEGYGGAFSRVASWTEFGAAAKTALARGGLQVIEVPTDRARNVVLHRQVWRAVAAALEPVAT
jgi:2-succinyl-5-enolpyruvyl-6-hydroxy-3-cyclohexene-1-carboxylate synthase